MTSRSESRPAPPTCGDASAQRLHIYLDTGGRFDVDVPADQSPEQSTIVRTSLADIQARTPPDSGWIVDVSRLRCLSVSLIDALTRAHRDFRIEGRAVRLRGLRDDMLPSTSRQLLQSILPPDFAGPLRPSL